MSEPTEQKKEEKTNYTRQLLKWGAVVLGFWLLYLALLFWADDICAYFKYTPHINHSSTFGVFGDYFGALNALFAGLAFAGLIVTIRQQSADLKATKEEMRQSRMEMELQTTQFSAQTELLKKQIVQQNKQNRIDKYVEFAYKIYEKIDEFDTMHKGGDFINSIHHLLKAYIYKKSGRYTDKEETLQKHSSFLKLYSEIGSICQKIYRLTKTIANDKEFTDDDRRTVAMVLLSTCGSEMLVALDYYLLVTKVITNDPEIQPMLISIFHLSGSDAAKNGLIRNATKHLQNDYEKSKEIMKKTPADVVDDFLHEIKYGNRDSFI